MIIDRLPDPRLFKETIKGQLMTSIIYASSHSKYSYPNHTTPYLLVANFKGTGTYRVNNEPVSINDRYFYFLNGGDRLGIDFKSGDPLATLLILFSDEIINAVSTYKVARIDKLLDNDSIINAQTPRIPFIPFEYNQSILQCLKRLTGNVYREEIDVLLFELLHCFRTIKQEAIANLDKITAKRKGTREEIYRRLFIAKMFIHDNFRSPVTLGDMAREACLNKFHFIALFKSYYGISPHQYLVKLKMEYALGLLKAGTTSVTDTCLLVGFESHGSFTHLFKRHYGIVPSQVTKIGKVKSQ
jgi:AraC family transcriptional regulator